MRQVVLSASLLFFAFGCTQDFGQYEPTSTGSDASTPTDGGKDAAKDSAVSDAPSEAGCTPSAGCTDTAKNCADQCRNQRDSCVNGCGSNNFCKQNCFNTYSTCKNGCATACVTCTTNAGCPGQTQCNAAVN